MLFILNVILYWMAGLSATAEQFFMLYFTIFFINLCSNSIGLLLGSLVTEGKTAAVTVPFVMLPLVVFSGLFKNTGNISQWLRWIQYICPIKYGYIILISN
jgi:ABC-type multidrug transport system permease subunit